MSSNLAPQYDPGEEMEVDLGGKSTTSTSSAMHSSDRPAVSHRAGVVPRGERCGRCFRNNCVRCVLFLVCMHAVSGFRESELLQYYIILLLYISLDFHARAIVLPTSPSCGPLISDS